MEQPGWNETKRAEEVSFKSSFQERVGGYAYLVRPRGESPERLEGRKGGHRKGKGGGREEVGRLSFVRPS